MPVAVLLYGIIYPAAGLALISVILLVVRTSPESPALDRYHRRRHRVSGPSGLLSLDGGAGG